MSWSISFIVTSRKEEPSVLRRTIDELLATTTWLPREIVVIDDGSTVPVTDLPSEALVIRNLEPLGVSRARRQGASMTRGDVLVWLDAHMTFDQEWLSHMLDYVDSGALLCSAFWDYERTSCHCFGADYLWSGTRDYHSQQCPGFTFRHRTSPPKTGAVEVPMVIGACYMMLRSSYDYLNGFSPLFRVWGVDEQDLSARAWLSGRGVKCVTSARVGHLWRPSFPYPVYFEDLEFNQLTMIMSLFEHETVAVLCRLFEPFPAQVQTWLDQSDLCEWRAAIQRTRVMTDAEFFARFVPELHHLTPR